jgi:hypothetical protein
MGKSEAPWRRAHLFIAEAHSLIDAQEWWAYDVIRVFRFKANSVTRP